MLTFNVTDGTTAHQLCKFWEARGVVASIYTRPRLQIRTEASPESVPDWDEECKKFVAGAKDIRRLHQDPPAAVKENEAIKQAGALHLKYFSELGKLIESMGWNELVRLGQVCDMTQGNNCEAHAYHASKHLMECIQNRIAWIRFNESVHEISRFHPSYSEKK
jgi:hypothetical protein